MVQTLFTDLDSWSVTLTLADGQNLISASAGDGSRSVTKSVTVVKDYQLPQVLITVPESDETEGVSSSSITVSGLASDDTQVASVSWSRTAGTDTVPGDAVGTENWSAEDIPLVLGVENTITITATDLYGKSGINTITVTRAAEATAENEDLTPDFTDPLAGSPDQDGDDYLGVDETACGSDPNVGDSLIENSMPANFTGARYPTNEADPYFDTNKVKRDENGSIIGSYLWPDCLNPDDDGDGLPDLCENKYEGFNSHDPSDNPSGDPDEDGNSNAVECRNGTDPFTPEIVNLSVTVTDVKSGLNFNDWLPEYEGLLKIEVTWTGTGSVDFKLEDTSRHPGRAVNDPDPAVTVTTYPGWYDYNGFDFGLTATNPLTNPDVHSFDQQLLSVTGTGNVYTAYLQSWDYGGRTKVVVTVPNDDSTRAEIWVPRGSGGTGIGNAWIYDQDAERLIPNADIDKIIYDKKEYSSLPGDDFNNFKEYRGIVYTQPIDGQRRHKRLNPHRKDLFVRSVGYDPVTAPFILGTAFSSAGIDVHNITDWGHDATERYESEYGQFFVYYKTGSITAIDGDSVNGDANTGWAKHWPKREWEFKLAGDPETAWTPIQYWGDSNRLTLAYPYPGNGAGGAYAIRKPVPPINVAIVRHDRTSLSADDGQDGLINFVTVIQPDQKNPFGSRVFTWDHKGHCSTNSAEDQPFMYGLPVTYKIPLDHYFGDRPYIEGTVWDSNSQTWSQSPILDSKLAPLIEVEDRHDQMTPQDGILPGDTPNATWDGDHRTADTSTWENTDQLNPFDIDNDGLVELPMASDPYSVAGISADEADRITVMMVTTTHELGHAVAGDMHTFDSACLMNFEAIDWRRADYFSDYFRSLIRVHNKIR